MNWTDIKKLYHITEDKNEYGYQEKELTNNGLNVSLPKVLKSYYSTLGQHKAINTAHNRLLRPDGEIGFTEDGYFVFYEENQMVAYWGIKKEDIPLDNPPVWGNYGTAEVPDWCLETKTTKDFLLLMAINNGTLGGLEYYATSLEVVKHEVVQFIQEKWNELTEISWEKQRFYTHDFEEVLSLSFDDKDNCTAIFIGTSHQDRFDQLLNLDIDWSYTSYEE